MQAAILAIFQGTGLTTIETFCNIFEHRCSRTVRGLMYIPCNNPLHVYILKMASKLVSFQKVMLVVHALSDPAGIINASYEEPYRLKSEGHILTQWEN